MVDVGMRARALRGIERYRASQWRADHAGSCRFTPSCSHYAEDALRMRSFLAALLLIAWRLVRCAPWTPRGTHDPVRRGSLRTVVGVLALAGITTLTVSWTAAAVAAPLPPSADTTTSGGCEARVGGQAIGRLDKDHALQVHKGQRIEITGVAPTGATGRPGLTTATIHFVENWAKTDTSEPSTGTTFRKAINVDKYLKYGSGVYRVDARSVAAGGWDCGATFYVEMNGSKIAAEIAVAAGAIGAVSVVASTRGSAEDLAEQMEKMAQEQQAAHDERERKEGEAAVNKEVDRVANFAVDSGWGCLVLIFGGIVSLMGLAALPAVGMDKPGRVWVKGHTVLGFFAGLLTGLGMLVAGWQFGLFPLTQVNVFLPLVVAVVSAARARRGRAWKVS